MSETQPLLDERTASNAEEEQPSAAGRSFGLRIRNFFGKVNSNPRLLRAVERTSTTFYDAATFDGSIWPSAIGPAFALSLWAALIVFIYENTDLLNELPNSILFITVIGVAFGYLMVFRTNTAYERFWEGRRLWSQLQIQIVNFGRIVWFGVENQSDEAKPISAADLQAKKGALNLLVALAAAVKHYLRDEPGVEYDDLKPYVQFIPEFQNGRVSSSSVPMDIILNLGAYVTDVKSKNIIDGSSFGTLTGLVSGFVETLTYFERICRTPIPRVYHVYIKQTLILYIASLPFQIVPVLHWWTVGVVMFGGGTLLGMEAIAREIENPFGTDINDLPIDDYIVAIRKELVSIMKTSRIEVENWGIPCELDFESLPGSPNSPATKPVIVIG